MRMGVSLFTLSHMLTSSTPLKDWEWMRHIPFTFTPRGECASHISSSDTSSLPLLPHKTESECATFHHLTRLDENGCVTLTLSHKLSQYLSNPVEDTTNSKFDVPNHFQVTRKSKSHSFPLGVSMCEMWVTHFGCLPQPPLFLLCTQNGVRGRFPVCYGMRQNVWRFFYISHIHAHTHTHIHTHTHTHTYTYTHTYTHTYTRTHTHILTHTHARTHTYTCTHTCTHTHTHTRTNTYTRTHTHCWSLL